MNSLYILIGAGCFKNRKIFGYSKLLIRIFAQDSSNKIITLMILDEKYDYNIRNCIPNEMYDFALQWCNTNKDSV
jgi:hypothetical protein